MLPLKVYIKRDIPFRNDLNAHLSLWFAPSRLGCNPEVLEWKDR